MGASTVACQQKAIAEVSATAGCLSQQINMYPSEAVTVFSAQTMTMGRQQQHCRKPKAWACAMQGETQHIIRRSTNTCDSSFYTSNSQEETAAAAAT